MLPYPPCVTPLASMTSWPSIEDAITYSDLTEPNRLLIWVCKIWVLVCARDRFLSFLSYRIQFLCSGYHREQEANDSKLIGDLLRPNFQASHTIQLGKPARFASSPSKRECDRCIWLFYGAIFLRQSADVSFLSFFRWIKKCHHSWRKGGDTKGDLQSRWWLSSPNPK